MRNYTYLILTSQTSTRSSIVGHEAQNLDPQRVLQNNFENIINRRVDISEDIQRFQKTFQYARSKVDYATAEYSYLLPSDMNLRIGRIRRHNNKILIASPSFKIRTNVEINLDGEKDKPDVKPKKEPDIKSNKEHKQDVKPNIEFNKENKPDMDKITYEEEKLTLILGMASNFTVWWIFK